MTSSSLLPSVWVVVKDGRILATNDEPCHLNGIEGVRYGPAEGDCGLSWDGHVISGDSNSIDAVRQTLHAAHTVELMRERIKELERRLSKDTR